MKLEMKRFNELSDKLKERALNEYRYIDTEYDWIDEAINWFNQELKDRLTGLQVSSYSNEGNGYEINITAVEWEYDLDGNHEYLQIMEYLKDMDRDGYLEVLNTAIELSKEQQHLLCDQSYATMMAYANEIIENEIWGTLLNFGDRRGKDIQYLTGITELLEPYLDDLIYELQDYLRKEEAERTSDEYLTDLFETNEYLFDACGRIVCIFG